MVDKDLVEEALTDPMVARLMTIPGVDAIADISIVAAAGDFSRTRHHDHRSIPSPAIMFDVSHRLPHYGEGRISARRRGGELLLVQRPAKGAGLVRPPGVRMSLVGHVVDGAVDEGVG
ncbi:hypothetical protein [Candidatus Mycolicibacterium alkanivorans]|uniref:Uncharacterized protein n=1 Tax=Candidatus Mycolicibacterium alkanivorans TaxID=2954114 RepID=A0ABS9YUT9_9MYCO|nr:hypothetical protein [Candidatus Mycolicibacterium alkanivorans]MCI4675006.1 hypothetical protein [Candidatus Mycolicibacterium alkanivorans]